MALGHHCSTPVAIITAIVLAQTGVAAAVEEILNIDITDSLVNSLHSQYRPCRNG